MCSAGMPRLPDYHSDSGLITSAAGSHHAVLPEGYAKFTTIRDLLRAVPSAEASHSSHDHEADQPDHLTCWRERIKSFVEILRIRSGQVLDCPFWIRSRRPDDSNECVGEGE